MEGLTEVMFEQELKLTLNYKTDIHEICQAGIGQWVWSPEYRIQVARAEVERLTRNLKLKLRCGC